jgi:hypothetical protein
MSRSAWPVSVTTNPEGAHVTIKNKKGEKIFNSTTPARLTLRSGSGYFASASYTVIISKAGYESYMMNINCKINGWYFGNILIGGFLGMLIIDPATGAMYKLDKTEIYENLAEKSDAFITLKPALLNIEKNKIPAVLESSLHKINL